MPTVSQDNYISGRVDQTTLPYPASGVVANLELGERLEVLFPAYLLSFPTHPFPVPLPCPSLPSFLTSLPLEVGPL